MDKPTVIYIPGYKNNGVKDNSVTAMRSAYRERHDHNVIIIDWTYYAKNTFYPSLIQQLKIVRKYFEIFFKKIIFFLDLWNDCGKFEKVPR
jgi:hypothetical protein